MTFPTAVCSALGLPAGADESAVLTAVNALRQSVATPPLETFVPRADYDAALARATNAETKLREVEAARVAAQVETLIAKALEGGQIVPATADYYRAMCQTESGVQAFEAFLAKAPRVIGPESGLDGKKPPQGTALNAELQQVSAMFGNRVKDLRKFGGLQ